MIYITEEQFNSIVGAVKSLPIRTQNFEEADRWVGLYLYLKNIERQISKEDGVNEDGGLTDK